MYNIFNMEKKKHTRADLHGFTHTHTHTYTKKTHTNTQTRTTKHTFETRIRTYARPRFSLQPPSGTRQPRRPARTRFLAKRSAASAATARPTKEIYPPHAQRLMKLSIFWTFVTGLLLPLDLLDFTMSEPADDSGVCRPDPPALGAKAACRCCSVLDRPRGAAAGGIAS